MSGAGPAVLSSLCLSILALLSCLGLLLHGLVQEEAGLGAGQEGLQEVHERLHHLEAEHDYILEAELQQVGQDTAEFKSTHGKFFDSTASCVQELGRPQFCSLLPDPGPCKAQVPRWYFLARCKEHTYIEKLLKVTNITPRTGDCLQFPWGGCRGNGNNFLTAPQVTDLAKTIAQPSPSAWLPAIPAVAEPPCPPLQPW